MGATPYDREWRKVRAKAIEEAEHRCRVCGVKRKRLEVDHIIGVKNDPTHQRLMVMCPSCHEIKTTLARRTKHPYTRDQLIALLHLSRQQQEEGQARPHPKDWPAGSVEAATVTPLKPRTGGRSSGTRQTSTSTRRT